MVMRKPKSECGFSKIFDWLEVGQAQGLRSPKWKATRSPGDIFSSNHPVFGNRRLDLDEKSRKLLLRSS